MAKKTRRKTPLATIEKVTMLNKGVPRGADIVRLTPHHVAGNASVEAVLGMSAFNDGRTASASYCISGGRMGLGVEETNRAWTSSSTANDSRSITFEIANIGGAPDWRISDADVNKFLDSAVDIARFYGFSKVHYETKPANISGAANVEAWINTWAKADELIITLHNWFASTACPGPYFTRQIPWLVREMNKRLQNPNWVPEPFVGEGGMPHGYLAKGAKGTEVQTLQQKLNQHGAILVEDGDFGPATEQAVKVFQTAKNLDADGVVGPLTWSELDKEPIDPAPPTPPVSSECPYVVRVDLTKAVALNVRKGPGDASMYPVVTTLINDRNAYTIIEEADGPGASKWGKLKSGIGWISLDYTVRL